MKRESLSTTIKLSGQVQATEEKTVILTAPIDGVVTRPLIKVGSTVIANQPLVEMNSVYGMTSLQVLEKLEKEQGDVVDARSKLSGALTNLTQAQADYGKAQAQVSSLTSDLRQVEADLEFANSDLRRKQELFEAGISAKVEVEEANTRKVKAEALRKATSSELEIAKRQVPLAERNLAQFKAAVALAREAVTITESNLARNKAVLSRSDIVGTEIPAELTSISLNANTSSAASSASGFTVRSPITGVVTKMSVSSGQRLTSGTQVGQVVELSEVYVDANAFEGDLARLREGAPIEVTSTSFSGQVFRGRIRYIGKQVNPATRTIQVRSLLDNPKGTLRPDTFVDVAVRVDTRPNALVIPEKALLTLGDKEYVIIEESPGQYRKQEVTIGLRSDDKIEILNGLKEGQKIVIGGNLLLESREH